jgi:hypothetical protein
MEQQINCYACQHVWVDEYRLVGYHNGGFRR